MNESFNVLIVEDDPVSRLLLEKPLTNAGYSVTSVQDGQEALKAFQDRFYPIVLTDWLMPGLDGLALCRAIRETVTEGYVFVILLTGKSALEDIVLGFEAGVDDYLTKPFNSLELIARLNTGKRVLNLEMSRRKAEKEIRQYSEGLEAMVLERTEQLRNSEERYRTILESIEDGYYEADLFGRLRFFNDATCSISGYAKDELMGKNARWLTNKESARKLYGAYRRVFVTGRPVKRIEWPLQCKSGEIRFLENSVSLMRDATGKPCGFRGMIRDVTERRVLENELIEKRKLAEEANRAKSEFLANLSHEIRTPLNGIIGMSELAMETCQDPDQSKLLKTIESEANSLYELINNILDLSKIEAKRMELDRVAFNLGVMIEDLSANMSMRARRKGLDFNTFLASDAPLQLMGDPGRLRQILTNLLVNALKFTHEGSIALRVAMVEDQPDTVTLKFTVEDTGIGIAPEKKDLIFERFTQADGSTTRKYGGTGLGTTISKQLAELMGGRIGLESEAGKGSCFWFTAVIEKDTRRAVESEGMGPALENLKVLLVNVDSSKRLSLVQHLSSWGCRFKTESSGTRAFAALREAADAGDPFSVVVTGNLTSDIDAFELSRKIRMKPEFERLGIMILLTNGMPGDADRCRQIGIDGYLTGEIEPESLKQAIPFIFAQAKNYQGGGERNLVTRYTISESKAHRRQVRVLLVEDYLTNQQLAMNHLRRAGYEVDLAENGLEAVSAFERTSYDLILMDMQMPVMDGYKAAKAIRGLEQALRNTAGASGRSPRIPIIATTANAMEGDRELCLQAGMDDYITKPLRKAKLLAMVEKWVAITLREELEPPEEGAGEAAIVDPLSEPARSDDPIAFERAIKEFEGDEDLLLEVLKEFIGNVKGQIGTIGRALADGNADVVRREAHSIKGGAADLTAARLSALAFELEKMGKFNTLEAAPGVLDDLTAELTRLEEFSAGRYPAVFAERG
jgi:PAS domain S-box-containing protein